ncbi:hypothetical protein AVEN_182025-1 [Araneus ventricosus]|uniref:Uncharacterized protein n=1 Tax=Araneus ventricosus TaxID=182803 RepID=A0A4Y2WZK4_ARAVE|nr:hypothetical protein AVEN_111801-1 [Araneus ventricosus]GBO41980.1 hypothetical protein AVEN_182025-1 [Araneus ventricosus]
MHPIRHWLWALPQLPQEIWPPLYRLLRMWGNSKSPLLRNEMPTYFILSPQGTKPTIHSPLEEEHPIQKLSRRNIDHLITFLATNEDLIKSQNTTPSHTSA